MILVSACLAGINCRYDGKSNEIEKIIRLVESGEAILVCPEQLGGMETPRKPCERIDDKVKNNDGVDKTKLFERGALETLKICKLYGVKSAILKSGSPSCGYGRIYDGKFSKTKIDGNGLTADLLLKNGIQIKTEKDI